MILEPLLAPDLLVALVGGTLLGIFAGAVPGLTATLAIALLLPLTFQLSTTNAIVMMTGIFTGGIYGGSIAAITIRIPGSPAAAMTMLDGHAMALQGRPGTAIGLATVSSFIGGIFGGIVLMVFAPGLAAVALTFQSPEMFSLVVLALVAVATVTSGSLRKGMASTILGLMLSTIGIDHLSTVPRLTLGSVNLLVGAPLIPVVIGLFALAELFHQAGQPERHLAAPPVDRSDRLSELWPALKAVGWKPFVKSPLIGTVVGALPGAGASMAAFLAYSEAQRASKTPDEFGSGAAEGIVAPETANNAMTGGALIPMLAFGIPGDAVTAVILGGLMIHGITPGPQVFSEAQGLVGPLFGAYFVSYVLILLFGLLLTPVLAKTTRLPRGVLFPLIAPLAMVASFTSGRTTFVMLVALTIGAGAYFLRRHDYPVIPVLLGLILGPMLETNFRRALILSEGDPTVFLRSPISLLLLIAAAVFPVFIARQRSRPGVVGTSS